MHRFVIAAVGAVCLLFVVTPIASAQFGIHAAAESAIPGWQRMESGGRTIWVNPTPSMTSSDLETAHVNAGPNGRSTITIVFNQGGTEKMCAFSAANFGKPIGILLDGVLISAPVVRSAMGKEAVIDGPGVDLGANELQRVLSSIDRRPQAPPASRCVPVRGRVTQLPKEGVSGSVLLLPDGGRYSSSTDIKSDGSFEFPTVPPGAYILEPTWNGMRMPPPHSSIAVADKAITGIELTIPGMKNIPGRVTVEGDGPMPPLQFLVSEGSWSAGFLALPKPDGTFSITLPEGERRFGLAAILPSGYSLKSFTSGPTNLRGGNTLKVTDTEPSELQLTFATAPDSWFKVSGRVRGYDPSQMARVEMKGQPLSNFEMSLEPAPIRADGTFEFPKVLIGSYILRVSTPNGDLSMAIDVTGNVADVELRR